MTIRSGSGIRALSADYLFESGFLVVTDRDVHAYRRATSFLEWQINVVPGLLQTEQYAREVLSGYRKVATISPMAIQRRLKTRSYSGMASSSRPAPW
jgi:Domain of unknown function (DUF5753)